MVEPVNEVRRAHGLHALRPGPCSGAPGSTAGLLAASALCHAALGSVSARYGRADELLAIHYGRRARIGPGDVANPPPHRAVLLSPGFRRVGVSRSTGRLGGAEATVWVLRGPPHGARPSSFREPTQEAESLRRNAGALEQPADAPSLFAGKALGDRVAGLLGGKRRARCRVAAPRRDQRLPHKQVLVVSEAVLVLLRARPEIEAALAPARRSAGLPRRARPSRACTSRTRRRSRRSSRKSHHRRQ